MANRGNARSTSFGPLLRSLRQEASLTQAELGGRAGLSTKAIGALERGERQIPHPSTVRAIIAALELAGDDRSALLESMEWRGGATAAGSDPGRADSPPGDGGGDRTRLIRESQRDAAWELYVELITRITVVELPRDQGMLRDALTSLHSLFETVRRILKVHGVTVIDDAEDGTVSVGALALTVLNDVVRPVLVEWHPALLDHESQRPSGVSPAEHERAWNRSAELWEVLSRLRSDLAELTQQLASAARA